MPNIKKNNSRRYFPNLPQIILSIAAADASLAKTSISMIIDGGGRGRHVHVGRVVLSPVVAAAVVVEGGEEAVQHGEGVGLDLPLLTGLLLLLPGP